MMRALLLFIDRMQTFTAGSWLTSTCALSETLEQLLINESKGVRRLSAIREQVLRDGSAAAAAGGGGEVGTEVEVGPGWWWVVPRG